MPMLDDLTIPRLPVELPAFHRDPFHFVDEARRVHPWLATFDAGYIVHGYQAARDLATMDDELRPGFFGIVEFYGAQDSLWGRFMDEMLISTTGDTHKRLRDSVAAGFTPRRANEIRPLMRTVIGDLLDEWVPRGEFDFAEFAAHFPIAVMCGLLGVSAESIPRVRSALETQMSSLTFNPALKPDILAAFDVLWTFADELVIDREKAGAGNGESELDAMIAARNAGQLSDIELRFMLLTFLLAGYDTSKNLLGMTMHTLLQQPEMYQRCAEDMAFCRQVVEEMLRFGAIATPFRQVAKTFEYDGVRFPEGALIALAFPLAGRDPAAFPDPHRFDPERDRANRHLGFGRGVHMCIGQFIARNQLEEGLHLIARRIGNPRLAGELTWRPFMGAWGLDSLPIAFDGQGAG